MLKKLLSLVLLVALIAMCGILVSAHDCSHSGNTNTTWTDGESSKTGCLITTTVYVDTYCSDCGEYSEDSYWCSEDCTVHQNGGGWSFGRH